MADDLADKALAESWSEQENTDDLVIKLATGGFGFSVSLSAFSDTAETGFLQAAWYVLLASVLLILLSKYLSVEGLRSYYVARRHEDKQKQASAKKRTDSFDTAVRLLNYVAGLALAAGAVLVAVHISKAG